VSVTCILYDVDAVADLDHRHFYTFSITKIKYPSGF